MELLSLGLKKLQGYTEYRTSKRSDPQYSSQKKRRGIGQESYLAGLLGLLLELLDRPLVDSSALHNQR